MTKNNMFETVINKVGSVVDTFQKDRSLYEKAKKKNDENKLRMERSCRNYSKTQIILEEEARRLDEIADKVIKDYKKVGEIILRDTNLKKQAEKGIKIVEELNFSKATLGAVAGGTVAAGGAVALVTAFCTAGTGAAISGLSGIFAVKATLAAFGGGTLASGGFGMVGGAVVGATIFTIPALAVGGLAAHKKIQDIVKKVNEATEKVDRAVEINKKLGEKNKIAADNMRKIYDLGVTIDFFLRNLQYRLEYAPEEIKIDMQKISSVARNNLVKTFTEINPFTENQSDISTSLGATLKQMEEECRTLQNILDKRKKDVIYTSQDINSVFQQIYRDAEKYIYMSYPWFNNFAVNSDLDLINQALQRGVKFYICYGFGDDQKFQNTLDAINLMKRQIILLDAVKFVRVDSHRKIILCEKYVLYGSQNMMTYRYNENRDDKRDEVTVKVEDSNIVNEFKNLILKQKEIKDL